MKNTQPIKLNRDFRRLYRVGKSVAGGYVVVYMKPNKRGVNRVGFAVGKQLGNAVTRNRAKRLMRESYRALEEKLTGTSDMIIVARNRAAGRTYSEISKDLTYALRALELLGGDSNND